MKQCPWLKAWTEASLKKNSGEVVRLVPVGPAAQRPSLYAILIFSLSTLLSNAAAAPLPKTLPALPFSPPAATAAAASLAPPPSPLPKSQTGNACFRKARLESTNGREHRWHTGLPRPSPPLSIGVRSTKPWPGWRKGGGVARQAGLRRAEGNACFRKARLGAAIDCYTEVIALCPDVAVYWMNRALCHFRRRDWAKVEEDSRGALALDHALFKVHYLLVCALLEKEECALAMKELEKVCHLQSH